MKSFLHILGYLLVGLLLAGCGEDALRPLVDAGHDAGEDALVDAGLDADAGRDGADVMSDAGDDGPPCQGLERDVVDLGLLQVEPDWREGELPLCGAHEYSLVLPVGSRYSLTLRTGLALGQARVTLRKPGDDPQSFPLAVGTALAPFDPLSLPLIADRSGEFVLRVQSLDPAAWGAYELRLSCESGCDLQATRYPIVLVHGWTGWNNIMSYTYFYGVADKLSEQGFLVFTASLDPYNSVEIRSGQLAEQIDGFLLEGQSRKVNLIAHSQGGLDSRRVISTLGYADRVPSLVTVSTPHRGTELCDVALGYLPGPGQAALSFLLEWLGATATGAESDAMASFEAMSVERVVEEFNPANPDIEGVSYVSYAGRTCPLGLTCGDICDIEIQFAYDLLWLLAGANDGIVPVESAIWGDYRGEIPADHFDEIGQMFGITGPNFDHREFYLMLARDLAQEGF